MLKMLLVEDDEVLRATIKEMLTREFPPLHVVEAASGEEALKRTQIECPRLILMDIRLPDKNGLQVTKEIKRIYPEMSVIIFTNYDLPEYREEAFNCGAEQFLAKGTTKRAVILSLVAAKIAELRSPNPKGTTV